VKAPWGVAAAGRVAANNGSALHFGHGSEGRASLRRGAGRFVNKAKAVRGNSNNRRLTQPSVDELTGCGERKSSGTSIAHRSDLTHARYFIAARVAAKCHNNPLLVLDERQRLNGKLQPRAATTFPGAQADSTATYLISLARPTEQRAGSFRNQQENL
jgi:hypothetical protein